MMSVVEIALFGALFGLVSALAVAMVAMAWRVPRAIAESNDKLHAKIDTSFSQLNAKIDATNAIMADVRERLAGLEEKVAGVDVRLAGLEEKVAGLEEKVAGVDVRLAGLEEKVAGVDVRLAGLEGRPDNPRAA